MFVLLASNGHFYNGRAGDGWLSLDIEEAFTYSREGADRKAEAFNRATCLHGLTFEVVARKCAATR